MTLDLNTVSGARIYVKAWYDAGRLIFDKTESKTLLQEFSDADFLRVSQELFLFADTRPRLGSIH